MLTVDILTLFPQFFPKVLSHSILKRAREKNLISVHSHDIRQFAVDKHKTCDDKPFGGGPGMLMKPEPIEGLIQSLYPGQKKEDIHLIYLSPQGKRLCQSDAIRLSKKKKFSLLCGHYEGIDQRIIDRWVVEEISIGDYVLTGGEIPALVVLDCVARLIPGVLGNEESIASESFQNQLLEYPQYTRPAMFEGMGVPDVLLSGNHEQIKAWREKESLNRTLERRPDLAE